jgi:hypothetical protein
MEKNKRKKYDKPKLKRVNLDAKCAVLGFCKTTGGGVNIALANCGVSVCVDDTS